MSFVFIYIIINRYESPLELLHLTRQPNDRLSRVLFVIDTTPTFDDVRRLHDFTQRLSRIIKVITVYSN